MRNSVFLIWTLLLIGIINLHAQEKDRHEFLVEADPLPFIMGGVGVILAGLQKRVNILHLG